MIHDQLKTELKKALKARETVRLSVVRSLLAALTNEAVAGGVKPDTPLDDQTALKVIKRAAKQRQDSINQYTTGGRAELAEQEAAELAIIKEFLPADIPEETIKQIAKQKQAELKIFDHSGTGRLIGAIIKETAGQADGAVVKKVVEELLT